MNNRKRKISRRPGKIVNRNNTNSKPKANVGKISKVENVADIPVVPFKKGFVPTRAPKTVIGQYQEPLMARPSSDIKGYKKNIEEFNAIRLEKVKRKVL